MELIKVGENTYYLANPTNIGIYKINDNDAYLIDTGNDKDTGKKILKIINEQGWNIKGIINTHSHADHTGGNKVINKRTNCDIFASDIENAFITNPILEPSFLYSSYPFTDLQNKFLMAKESPVSSSSLPNYLETISLKGHSYNMIGIKTPDNIYFLGDALASAETISKYQIFFIYNVKDYLNTLDYLSTLKGDLFILSHAKPLKDISSLITLNRQKITEICNTILSICTNPITFENLLTTIFNQYNLNMNLNQYYLISSTLKSYISYLYDEKLLTYEFNDNKMYWRKVNEI